jgi:predicted MFS family arabinose efflux permease
MSAPLWNRRLWALLLMLSGNMLLDALEVSTTVIALPAIGRDLHLTAAQSSWLMTGFAVGFGGFIVLGGRLTLRWGRRGVYLWALLAFAVASVVAGLATDAGTLVVARIVKGVCVALTAPTGLAIIAGTFPEGPPRQRALSVYALFGASGFSIGLLLSGALTLVSWRWTLLFSGPVALVLLVVALRVIPRDTPVPATADPGGAPAFGTALVRSAAGAAALNGAFWGFLLVSTFEMQARLHWSPLVTGLVLLPASLPLAVSAMFSGRLIGRFGAARLVVAGSLAALAGYAWYLLTDARLPYRLVVLPTVVLVGVAFMLSFSALHVQAVTGVPPGRQRIASGLYQTAVQIGGAAVLVVLALGTPAPALITAVAAGGLLLATGGLRRRPVQS